MTTCKRVYQHICASLDEELSTPRCRAIRRHIDECPNCQAYLDSLKKTIRLYRMTASPRVPRAVHSKLLGVIRHEFAHEGGRTSPAPRSGARRAQRRRA